ncbi:MAG TPA: hypothetical protein VEG39_21080 [Clostridia bacterium]|nr:hypothetical protein [Clostridia bacterium]
MEMERLLEEKLEAENRVKDGAGWFYWIAGLSVINTLITFFGGNWNFVIGLGITQVLDAIAYEFSLEAGNIFNLIAVAMDIFIAGIFAYFGLQAGKRKRWAFILGMVLYALDGLLFLLVSDWMSIGFHILALYSIFKGYRAIGGLLGLEAELDSARVEYTAKEKSEEPGDADKMV